LFTLLASSGLRVGKSALKLQIKHFIDDLWDKSLPCYALEIPEALTKAPDGGENHTLPSYLQNVQNTKAILGLERK
jgi:hypothetical protein